MRGVKKYIAIAGMVAITVVVAVAEPAGALSKTYFDGVGDVSPDVTTRVIAGADKYVRGAQVNASAYFTSNSGSVTLLGSNWCYSDPYDWKEPQPGNSVSSGTNITKYVFGDASGNFSTKYGKRTSSTGNGDDCGSITITSTNLIYNANINLWYMDISADSLYNYTYGYQNGFRIRANGANAYVVAQRGGQSGRDVTLQVKDTAKSTSSYYTYITKFGADCSVSAGRTARISLYDLDNLNDNSGAQVGRDITIRLYEKPSGSASFSATTIWGSNGNHVTTYTPSGGSSTTQYLYFTVKPGAAYEMRMYDVYYNNTIQVSTPYDGIYYLRPCPTADWKVTGASSSTATSVVAGDPINWTHTLDKSGTGTADITYRVKRSMNGASGPYVDVPGASGTTRPSANGRFATRSTAYPTTAADVGKRICEYIEWSPTDFDTSGASQSTPYCVRVGVRPVVHILGNDVRVGSGFSLAGNKNSLIEGGVSSYNGSGSEYGVIAPSSVLNFDSNSAAFNGVSSGRTALTFANTNNTPCGGGGGCYTNSSSLATLGVLPNVSAIPNLGTIAQLTDSVWRGVVVCNNNNTSFNITDLSSQSCRRKTGAPFTLGGPTYNLSNFKGSVAVKTTGDVTINSDIKYTQGSLQKDSEIPQLVILANNISISPSVTRIDAWLIATGTVDTCAGVADASLRLGDSCSNQLTINGPVMAAQLAMKRTAYTTASPKDPAEVIRLRGDAYIWASGLSRLNGSWKTTYTTELPPRY